MNLEAGANIVDLSLRPSGAPAVVLKVSGLSKQYGRLVAVDECSFEVLDGDIFGLLGPNGAGKSTTLRMLAGLVRPDRGSISMLGQPMMPGGSPPPGVGVQIERPAIYPYLSALDNLMVVAMAGGLPHPRRESQRVLAVVGLESDRDRPTRQFSTGMRQRLAVAVALLGEPRLLLLDEPTSGLDPEGLVEVRALLHELRNGGVTTLLSSHLLAEVEQSCNRIAVMRHGRIVALDSTAALAAPEPELLIRFTQPEDAERARETLGRGSLVRAVRPAGHGVLILAGSSLDGEAIGRALGAVSLFPSEITIQRRTLEERYLELVETDDRRAGRTDEASVG